MDYKVVIYRHNGQFIQLLGKRKSCPVLKYQCNWKGHVKKNKAREERKLPNITTNNITKQTKETEKQILKLWWQNWDYNVGSGKGASMFMVGVLWEHCSHKTYKHLCCGKQMLLQSKLLKKKHGKRNVGV